MRILVTGGAGFIGSHIVEYFQGRADVCVLDSLRTGFEHNLAGFRCELMVGSILDRDLLHRAMQGVDYVFHLAAMTSVPESIQNPEECRELNTSGTLMVLEEAAFAGVKKLIFSSSAAIYGDNPVIPKLETMTPNPKSPYAISKLAGEYYCQTFTAECRLPTTSLRYFNVYGPRQNPQSQYAPVVPIFFHHAGRHEPIIIFGDGDQTRDFIYVGDIVAANVFFAMQSQATGVFNIANGQATRINDLAAMICRLTNSRSITRKAPERTGDVKHSMASIAKLSELGFTHSTNLSDGLLATLQYKASANKLPLMAIADPELEPLK